MNEFNRFLKIKTNFSIIQVMTITTDGDNVMITNAETFGKLLIFITEQLKFRMCCLSEKSKIGRVCT